MGKSFHSVMRDSLDAPLQRGERIDAKLHYAAKRAMREANMRGKQFQSEEELAQEIYTLTRAKRFQ